VPAETRVIARARVLEVIARECKPAPPVPAAFDLFLPVSRV
jgi:hypothetical protein